jgi:hypothetical protein
MVYSNPNGKIHPDLQSNNTSGDKEMSDNQQTQPTKAASLKDIEAVRDLFARAHDYIAQAQYQGHMGMKVAEVLNFLAFQHGDFKQRAENLAKVIEAEAKAAASTVDTEAAKAATSAALEAEVVPEAPKA